MARLKLGGQRASPLTATVRDLHLCYPGRFETDVRTSCPELWLHNPCLTPLQEGQPGVQVIDCHYPLIDRINTVPYHFLHGFTEHLNDVLGLQVKPMEFKGDIHLGEEEEDWFKRVEDTTAVLAVRLRRPVRLHDQMVW